MNLILNLTIRDAFRKFLSSYCDYLLFLIQRENSFLPFNSQIEFVILLTINHTIFIMLVPRT